MSSNIVSRRDPDNAAILDGLQRATDSQRQLFVSHLNQMHAQGALSAELHRARVDDALKAETTFDLGRLIADLPPMPAPDQGLRAALHSPSSWLREHWNDMGVILIVHTTIVVLAICLVGLPSALLGEWGLPTSLSIPLIISGIVVGVIGLISGLLRVEDVRHKQKMREAELNQRR